MDSVTVFSLLAILLLSTILYMTLNPRKKHTPKSAHDKKREIIETYKQQMYEALAPLQDNAEILKQKKSALLKEISIELSRNIFFDHDEMRAVIQELAHYDYKEAQ
jgi:hypothetical protein